MNAKNTIIITNKKAKFDYYLEEEYIAGLVLHGWEVKSLRSGKINLSASHIIIKYGEAFLIGAQIQPLPTAAKHVAPDPLRTRKLLLHQRELKRLIGGIEREGYTLIPLELFWRNNHIKAKIALAKGKKTYDKRDTIKEREWQRNKSRLVKSKLY